MANIPLPKTPDVKSATGFSQVDPNTGNQVNRALQGLGGAVAEAGKTFAMFAEKKQNVMNSGAESAQDLAVLQAKGKIDKFTSENQDDPDAIKSFSQDTMSGVLDDPAYMKAASKADEGTQNKLLEKFRYQSERSRLETENVTTTIEVNNANTSILNTAQTMIDRGDIQGGITKSGEASISDNKREDWIIDRVRKNLYSKVDMHLTSLETPEEFREFQEGILSKDVNGLYDSYVAGYDVSKTGKSKEVLEISGLTSPQRDALATLAYKKELNVLSDQTSNLKSDLRLASRGDPEAVINMEKRMLEDGKGGYPESRREGIQKTFEDSIKKYRDGESMKVMKSAAGAGKSKKKYKDMQVQIATAVVDPTNFDEDDMVDRINGMDIASPVKADLLSQVMMVSAAKYRQAPENEGEAMDGMFDSFLFVEMYKYAFGEQKFTKKQGNTLGNSFTLLEGTLKEVGNYDELPDDVNRIHSEVHKFFKNNPEPTQSEIDQFEDKLHGPIERRRANHRKNK